jgi:hypothetical protein
LRPSQSRREQQHDDQKPKSRAFHSSPGELLDYLVSDYKPRISEQGRFPTGCYTAKQRNEFRNTFVCIRDELSHTQSVCEKREDARALQWENFCWCNDGAPFPRCIFGAWSRPALQAAEKVIWRRLLSGHEL